MVSIHTSQVTDRIPGDDCHSNFPVCRTLCDPPNRIIFPPPLSDPPKCFSFDDLSALAHPTIRYGLDVISGDHISGDNCYSIPGIAQLANRCLQWWDHAEAAVEYSGTSTI